MKKINPVRLIPCAIILFIPVIIWNVWLLDYINANGKALVWIFAPVFAFLSSVAFFGTGFIRMPVIDKRHSITAGVNPFYGWLFISLIIEVWIAAASNT